METKEIELTDEMLEKISGGGKGIGGVSCPNCKGFIPTSTHQIITSPSITCPHCGLRLRLNRPESSKCYSD